MKQDQKVAKTLKELRKSNRFTQQHVADYLGVSKSTIQFYESGRMKPHREKALKLCELYNVGIDYLLGTDPILSGSETIEYLKELETIRDVLIKEVRNNHKSIEALIAIKKNRGELTGVIETIQKEHRETIDSLLSLIEKSGADRVENIKIGKGSK